MATESPRIAPPWHPLFQGFDAPSIEDSLNNCVATLRLLSDLFGGNDDQYPILDSSDSRRDYLAQLQHYKTATPPND